jgi:hypothetical protein
MRIEGLWAGLAAAVISSSGRAQDEEITEPVAPPSPPIELERELHWNDRWPRIHPAEYAIAPAAMGGAFALKALRGDPPPNWTGGILFDDAFVDATFPDDLDTYQAWKALGDAAFYGSFALGAEPIFSAMAQNPDVGWQVLWMNLEAYSVFSSMLYLSQFVVRRERPSHARLCGPEQKAAGVNFEELSTDCAENLANSFIGGHVAAVSTATTLVCIHHAYLPLFGGGLPEAIPCAVGVIATGFAFTSRSVNGRHYLSDNVLGLGVGAVSGLVPWALHYARDTHPETGDQRAGEPRILGPTIMPVEGHGLQLGVMGIGP